jgi:hypothetical protein
MAITLDGTNGITTPDVDTDGLTVDTNTLFVDAANNRVGVGIISPATKVDIFGGDARVGLVGASAATFRGYQIASDTTEFASLKAESSLGETRLTSGFSGFGGFTTFHTNGSERARIDASGNLLVGTTSAVGTTGLTISSPSLNGVFSAAESASATNHIRFYNTNGVVGAISTSGTATTYATSSDYRLKEDVQPMVGASDRLMALKPVNFAWKVDGSRVDGFLAHEAQEVVPECVTGEKDQVQIVEIKDEDGNVTGAEERPVYQGIDQSKIVPLLVAALQEALTKIEALEARVAALETNA